MSEAVSLGAFQRPVEYKAARISFSLDLPDINFSLGIPGDGGFYVVSHTHYYTEKNRSISVEGHYSDDGRLNLRIEYFFDSYGVTSGVEVLYEFPQNPQDIYADSVEVEIFSLNIQKEKYKEIVNRNRLNEMESVNAAKAEINRRLKKTRDFSQDYIDVYCYSRRYYNGALVLYAGGVNGYVLNNGLFSFNFGNYLGYYISTYLTTIFALANYPVPITRYLRNYNSLDERQLLNAQAIRDYVYSDINQSNHVGNITFH